MVASKTAFPARVLRPTLARGLAVAALALAGCQGYEFVFQPDAEREGVNLNFSVQTPSKADILFVVDNTGSMLSKQQALASSITTLLDGLAPQDTSYRIGIVSADAHGFLDDCNGNANPPVASNNISYPTNGAKGNCARPELAPNGSVLPGGVALRRPHDGTMGRLMAAYDPQVFDPNRFVSLNPNVQAAIAKMLPTSAIAGPPGINGDPGARWVIDRDAIRTESCNACNCATCDAGDPNYTVCALPAAQAMVQSYFLANINGLGTSGFGWVEGLKSAMWTVGINPEDPNDATALTPAYDLTAGGAPNSYTSVDDTGALTNLSWLRDDALLAVMFVTDSQDCSMPLYLMEIRSQYEEPNEPLGSICFQPTAQQAFLPTYRMAQLLTDLKGGSAARVAVGFIGGVEKTGAVGQEGRSGTPTDCAISSTPTATPPTQCSCLDNSGDTRWCALTQNTAGPPMPGCDGFDGSRFVYFANYFSRTTFESICRNDSSAFGPTLTDFARVATLACFDLGDGLHPYNNDPNNIVVKRSAKGSGAPPATLPMTSVNSSTEGWYYDVTNNKICLTGLDRLIGDDYSIFVLDRSNLSYTQ